MLRVRVIVEGETEETFVNALLSRHLGSIGPISVSARLMGNARMRGRRGGIRPWPEIRKEILNLLRQDRELTVTTMVDFYGLPHADSEKAWPGRAEASTSQFAMKAELVENAMTSEVAHHMGSGFDRSRFVPFVIMHEFEGLLFSDCKAFARAIGQPDVAPRMLSEAGRHASPEEINDTPDGHPAARILRLIPNYQKPLFGNLASREMGLEPIRRNCPHFASWLLRLESLASASG